MNPDLTLQRGKLIQYSNGAKKLRCHHQWYFIPLNETKEKIYIIQSAYNDHLIGISSETSSDSDQLQHQKMAKNNLNQFRLIPTNDKRTCQIQSLATHKALYAHTDRNITQIKNTNSTDDQRQRTLWRLIPCSI